MMPKKKRMKSSYNCPPNIKILRHSPQTISFKHFQILLKRMPKSGNFKNKNEFVLNFAQNFSRIDNLNWHMNNRCKKAQEHLTYKNLFLKQNNSLKKKKKNLKTKELLTKVGNVLLII